MIKNYPFKIGVIIDSFQTDVKSGIEIAAKIGAQGIQMYATQGEMAPENLSAEARKELLEYIRSLGLVVSAVCGDLGGHGFEDPVQNPWKIEKSKRIMDLALDLDCKVVTTHIGVIPTDSESPKYKTMKEACEQLGEYADSIGSKFAIETGPESAIVLKTFLDSLDSDGVWVNMDPANLAMVTGDDPVKAVEILSDYIIHTHAKDGILLRKTDPEIIYNYFAEGGIGDLHLEDYFKEVPLGKGQVDFDGYLDALYNTGFDGFLTIEREVGENPQEDIKEAINFLKNKMERFLK